MSSATTPTMDLTVEVTYHPGRSLQLYSHAPPIPPSNERCPYEGPIDMAELPHIYKKSIEERIPIPSAPPNVSITLEKRFNSSMHNIPHVWLARVVETPTPELYPSKLVAKIYDPVWFDDAPWFDPFDSRNLVVSREVETYHRFEQFQGTRVPRFYGHFIAAIPSQENRTVNVVLMELIPGRDLRSVVPTETASTVCTPHRDGVIEALLDFVLDMEAYGVRQLDLQPRNIIVLPPKERREFCTSSTCPLRFEADHKSPKMVMIDFERVEFIDQVSLEGEERRKAIEDSKPYFLENWLEGYMV